MRPDHGPGEPERERGDGYPHGHPGAGPHDGRMAAGQPDLHGGTTGHGKDAAGTEVCHGGGFERASCAAVHPGDDERGGGGTVAADAHAGTVCEGEGRTGDAEGPGRAVPPGTRAGQLSAAGGRQGVFGHRPAVCGGTDGAFALPGGPGGGGLPAAAGGDGTGGTQPRTGGGGVLAQAEGAGSFAGMPGHRGEPAEPAGGADVQPAAGTEASAGERGHRTGCRHGADAVPRRPGKRPPEVGTDPGQEPARGGEQTELVHRTGAVLDGNENFFSSNVCESLRTSTTAETRCRIFVM